MTNTCGQLEFIIAWTSPHRVVRNSKFYARHSAGRYPLESGGCMVVHVLPLNAFLASTAIDLGKLGDHMNTSGLMGTTGWNHRINIEGIVNFTTQYNNVSGAYTQVFRSGVLEYVSVSLLRPIDGEMILPSVLYEQEMIQLLTRYLKFARELELHPPYYVFLSFLGVSGCRFGVQINFPIFHEPVLNEDMLILPEVVVQNRDEEPHEILHPIFDMVWNSFGFAKSKHYDDSGNWRAP